MFRSCLIAALVFSAQSSFAQGQTQTQDPNAINRDYTYERYAIGGKKTTLGPYYSLKVDCSPTAWQEVRVVKPPENGEAKVVDTMTPINFSAPNPREKCNGKSTKSKALEYIPTKGYLGSDVIEVETINDTGEHHTYTYNMTVK